MNSTAFILGTEYFLQDKEINDNPYDIDSPEYEEFEDGYLFEQDMVSQEWK